MRAGETSAEGKAQALATRKRRRGARNWAAILYIVLALLEAALTYYTMTLVRPGGRSEAVGMWVVFIWLPALLAGALATVLLILLALRARSTRNLVLAGVGILFYFALFFAVGRPMGWI